MTDIAALLLKLAGIGFLGVATIGLIRFDDPFQRMHAATKAGTLGAGLVLVGTILSKGTMDAALTGSLALVFLVLTIPVASHLLARAAYISGAELAGIGDSDALRGTLGRLSDPLEERLDRAAFAPAGLEPATRRAAPAPAAASAARTAVDGPPAAPETAAPETAAAAFAPPPRAERIRFAALGRGAPGLARRAAAIAARERIPAKAVVALDTRLCEATGDPARAMRVCRAAVGEWLPQLRAIAEAAGCRLDLDYAEGDAEALIAGRGDCRELLVLPTEGWADHDAIDCSPFATRRPDGLLRLSRRHPGPVLHASGERPEGPSPDDEGGAVVVAYDGSPAVKRALALALDMRLWPRAERLRVVGDVGAGERVAIEALAASRALPVAFEGGRLARDARPLLPAAAVSGAGAVILPDLPGPLRTDWYGTFWQDRIAPGWRGDVLVWT